MKDLFSEENQVVTIVIVGVLMLLLMGGALLLFFFLSRKKIIEKELEKKNLEIAHQKEMLQSIIVTQEEERKRIAQDLHDDISSKLNVIHLNANLIKVGELSIAEVDTINSNIIKTTDKTLESARKIAHNLLPPILEKFGLQPALEELADDFSNSKKIKINYKIDYNNNRLTKNDELHIFRIVQELINNSVRHGKAKQSNLTLLSDNNSILLEYSDNGIGFDASSPDSQKGLGTKNIESRVDLLQGILLINSTPGKGINVQVKI